jgi:hypothetical protein
VSFLISAAVVAVVFFVVVGAFIALGLYWASRRGLLRRARLRVQVEGASVGSRRRLAQCEIDLDRALTDARQAITSIAASGASTLQLDVLLAQLEGIGGRLRGQLQSLTKVSERNLDRMLPPLVTSVDQVGDIVDQLATAAGATTGGGADAELTALTQGTADALMVLDQRVAVLRELD